MIGFKLKLMNLGVFCGFVLLLLFSFTNLLYGQEKADSRPKYLFYKANRFYKLAEYDKAIAEYTKLLDRGSESGSLYYNIGNCYFKNGNIGRAILNYERAKRLIPRDKDLQSNYRYADSLIKDGAMKTGSTWFRSIINKFSNEFTLNGVTILMSIIYILSVLAVISGVIFKLPKKAAAGIVSVFGLFFALTAVSFFGKVSSLGREAIIVDKNTNAKFEPLDRATTHFILYEGMKVRILLLKDDWYKIKRPDGKSGWIKGLFLEVI